MAQRPLGKGSEDIYGLNLNGSSRLFYSKLVKKPSYKRAIPEEDTMYTEKQWEEFLSQKGKTAKLHYSLRKNCLKCNRPIVNKNESGYCWHCSASMLYLYNKRLTGKNNKEGEEHKTLKMKATKFLQEIGCENIQEEVRVGRVIIDVLGDREGNKIGVECGGSLLKKLFRAQTVLSELYILPYGGIKPYKWTVGVRVCYQCGHKI